MVDIRDIVLWETRNRLAHKFNVDDWIEESEDKVRFYILWSMGIAIPRIRNIQDFMDAVKMIARRFILSNYSDTEVIQMLDAYDGMYLKNSPWWVLKNSSWWALDDSPQIIKHRPFESPRRHIYRKDCGLMTTGAASHRVKFDFAQQRATVVSKLYVSLIWDQPFSWEPQDGVEMVEKLYRSFTDIHRAHVEFAVLHTSWVPGEHLVYIVQAPRKYEVSSAANLPEG